MLINTNYSMSKRQNFGQIRVAPDFATNFEKIFKNKPSKGYPLLQALENANNNPNPATIGHKIEYKNHPEKLSYSVDTDNSSAVANAAEDSFTSQKVPTTGFLIKKPVLWESILERVKALPVLGN
jgi:hypothetical protein